jgi:hypothetical protein
MFFVLFLVVMNILIAILGDSFDKVQNDKNAYDTLEKIKLLLETNYIYVWNRNKMDVRYI